MQIRINKKHIAHFEKALGGILQGLPFDLRDYFEVVGNPYLPPEYRKRLEGLECEHEWENTADYGKMCLKCNTPKPPEHKPVEVSRDGVTCKKCGGILGSSGFSCLCSENEKIYHPMEWYQSGSLVNDLKTNMPIIKEEIENIYKIVNDIEGRIFKGEKL